MIFGKHINRYYLKYALWLIAGLASLVMVDYLELEIPKGVTIFRVRNIQEAIEIAL